MRCSVFPSKENTNNIKAFLAMFVLAHHIYQEIPIFEGTVLNTVFLSLGYLSVAAFLFLSGYGLAYSEKVKGEAYVKDLPVKRISPFFMHILVLNIIYFFLYAFLNGKFNFSGLINAVFRNDSLIRNGWYLTVSLMAYIVFYFVYRLIKNTALRLLAVSVIFMIYGIACIRVFQFGFWWYESNFAFVVGLIWGTLYSSNQKKKSKIIFYALLLCSITVFVAAFYLVNKYNLSLHIYLFVKGICSIAFSVSLILLGSFLRLQCKAVSYISKISFEIYVSQGLFLSLFHSNKIYISNPILYAVAVAGATIVFAAVLNIVLKKLDNRLIP